MVTLDTFDRLVQHFPEVEVKPHFEKISFRVRGKIFATLAEKERRVTVKLSEVDQDVFCLFDKSSIYPVPNKWGKKGWTFIELSSIEEEILADALCAAYCEVAPPGLRARVEKK